MSLGLLLTAIWLILTGVFGLDTTSGRAKFMAVLAIAAGAFLIIEAFHPIPLF